MKSFLIGALAALLSLPAQVGPTHAEDFTFKRVGPPAPDATRRINIQITEPRVRPAAPRPGQPRRPDLPTARTAPSEPADRSEHQAWFWSAVSPSIGAVDGRFVKAAKIAARPPRSSGVVAPPLDHMQRIARHHGGEILRHSVGTRVSPALVLALISVESSGRIAAVSNKGATGLMQLIPATAARFGARDMRDPSQNIAAGVAYLDWLMEEFGNDPVLALAGYNAGEGAVRRYGGVPPFGETRTYVPRVLAAWNVARLMCQTPPVMPADGCVFDASLTES